jgi:hypothetical protein
VFQMTVVTLAIDRDAAPQAGALDSIGHAGHVAGHDGYVCGGS